MRRREPNRLTPGKQRVVREQGQEPRAEPQAKAFARGRGPVWCSGGGVGAAGMPVEAVEVWGGKQGWAKMPMDREKRISAWGPPTVLAPLCHHTSENRQGYGRRMQGYSPIGGSSPASSTTIREK